jgi:hypothetical protein
MGYKATFGLLNSGQVEAIVVGRSDTPHGISIVGLKPDGSHIVGPPAMVRFHDVAEAREFWGAPDPDETDAEIIVGRLLDENLYQRATSMGEIFYEDAGAIGTKDIEIHNQYQGFESKGSGECSRCDETRDINPEGRCKPCHQNDPPLQEALEWWLVASPLANRLKSAGELIMEAYGVFFWGRQTSGQAVKMDSVIQDVCR